MSTLISGVEAQAEAVAEAEPLSENLPIGTNTTVDAKPGKKRTRQWAAWTRQEEESFFNALRQVGKNFAKITFRVGSKNKDQVRHYYYRLVKRINKLLAPGYCLDAKNTKDTNAAMLRWWGLLEKYRCTASKLHRKPRRFKLFRGALEHQLLKDRNKTRRKHHSQEENLLGKPPATVFSKVPGQNVHPAKVPGTDAHSKGTSLKRNGSMHRNLHRGDLSSAKPIKQKRRTAAPAAYKRWEKEAIAGVSLVADAAEQLERAGGKTDVITIVNTLYTLEHEDIHMHHVGHTIAQPSTKLKLQLFPINENTRKALENDAHNPHLELTLSAKKRISSVIEHLNRKWGNSSIASGQLMLFPYNAQYENIESYQRWTIKDTVASAADVYATTGSSLFRLRYGWISSDELAGIIQSSSGTPNTCNCIQSRDIKESDDRNNLENSAECQSPKQYSGSAEDRYISSEDPLHPMPDIPNVPVDCSFIECTDNSKEHDDGISSGTESGVRGLAMEWADNLTNISVGDLLSEASRAFPTGTRDPCSRKSDQCFQQLQQSFDSFDAAIAAHASGYQLPTTPSQMLPSALWSNEDTCDEFSFQLVSASRPGGTCSSKGTSSRTPQETCPGSLSFHEHLKVLGESDLPDGSLCIELKAPLECSKESPAEHGNLDSSKELSLTDIYWPDSLYPLDLDMPPSRYQGHDLVFGDSLGLSGFSSNLLANSFGALCSFTSPGMDKERSIGGQ